MAKKTIINWAFKSLPKSNISESTLKVLEAENALKMRSSRIGRNLPKHRKLINSMKLKSLNETNPEWNIQSDYFNLRYVASLILFRMILESLTTFRISKLILKSYVRKAN